MRSLFLPWRTALALVAALVAPSSAAQAPARAVPTGPTATFFGLPTAESFQASAAPMASFGADLLNETFTDTTFPAAGWTLLQSGGSGTFADWKRDAVFGPCYEAPCASAAYNSPLQDRYLVTPQVTPTAGGSTLTFRSAQPWADFPSEYHVMVSTTTPTVGAFTDVAVYDNTTMATGALAPFSVDLSAYIGTPIYIAFMHRQNNGNQWMLDDVRIAQSTPAAFAGAGLAYQNRGIVSPGWRMWAVAANVYVSGDAGSVTVNRLTFDTAGTTDVADLTLAQLYYTGAGTTIEYGTTPLFGSNIGAPSGEMTFLGSRALAPGNNHFVLVYWTNSSATPGHRLDATFTGVSLAGDDHPATVRSLTGALSVARTNDALAEARVVDAASYSYTDANQSATAEAGEASASCTRFGAGNDGRQSLWYAYTPLASGSATFSSTSGYDALLSVHTGTAFPLTEIACADASSYSDPESVTFSVTAGTTYYLRISGGTYSPTGTATVSVNGPAPAFGAFAFEQPTMDQQFRVGSSIKAIWDSPSAPVASSVNLYLRTAAGAETLIYTGANLQQPDFGAARYVIPATTLTGTYTLRIEDADAPSRTATSAPFTILDTDGRFEFTSPVGGEAVAYFSSTPVTWTSPANASGGTVTITLVNRDGQPPVVYANVPNTGAQTVGFRPGRSYVTIVSDQAPAYSGRSRNVRADIIGSARLASGTSFAAGEVLPVRWTATTLAGITTPVDLMLMHPVHGNRLIAAQVTSSARAYDYTLPIDVAPGDGYSVRLRFSGVGGMRSIRTGTFSITGDAPRTAAAPHFDRPTSWGTDGATLVVAAPGLDDGAEVGAFAASRLVGTGIVAGGVAEVTVVSSLLVPALVADGRPEADDFVYLADDTVLVLRVFADGVETDLETEAPVAYAAGTEVEVVATGAAGVAPTFAEAPAALTVEAYPNPATTRATVRFAVPAARPATVTVYDLLGRTVATPFAGEAEAGRNEALLPTQALPAGVYVVRVVAGAEVATTRLTVVR